MRRLLLAAAVLAAFIVAPAARAWTWPVEGTVLRAFALTADPYAGGQHRGIDVAAPEGSPVRAASSGTVSFVGSVPNGGKVVTIQTGSGYAVTALQLGSTAVVRGAAIEEGAIVGAVGPSSDTVTAEPHVHLGVRVAAEPEGYVDPLSLLPPRSPAAPVPQPVPLPQPVPAPQPAPAPQPVAVQQLAPVPQPAAPQLPPPPQGQPPSAQQPVQQPGAPGRSRCQSSSRLRSPSPPRRLDRCRRLDRRRRLDRCRRR